MEKGVGNGSAGLLWAALFAIVATALIAAGYGYYRFETGQIRTEKYQDLAAIGKLKVDQIQHWRYERLADSRRSSKAPFVGQGIRDWLRNPSDVDLRTRLKKRLILEQKEKGYADVLLVDTEKRILLSASDDPHPLGEMDNTILDRVLTARAPMLTDLYRCGRGMVHMDAVAPFIDPDGKTFAVLILRSDAESLLYPLIQSWPTQSRTAETLLVRKDGNDVLFLNNLRHRQNSALELREPLTATHLPAVQAVLGRQGIFQGTDYRGVEVIADLRPVPESPWFMVAKVDESEIMAEANYRGMIVVAFVAVFILLAASITAYAYRYRQTRLYLDLYRSEREQREAQEEFRTTLYSIGDAVITTDTDGLVKQMNPSAERFTGWLESDAQGKPVREIFRIINEETRLEVENPVNRVLREGLIVGLANHTVLVTKDGKERPVADSGAPIRNEDGIITGVVLVFQDQTQAREARKALQESQRRYRDLWEKAPVMMISLDSNAVMNFVSDLFCEELGYDREYLLGRTPFEFQTESSAKYAQTVVFPSFLKAVTVKEAPLQLVRKNGEVIDVLLNVTTEKDAQGNPVRSRSVFIDVTERNRAEAAIRASEAKYLDLYENAPDMYVSLDPFSGLIHQCNQTMSRVTGYSKDELIGRPIFDVYYPSDIEEARKALKSVISDGEVQNAEFRILSKNKNIIDVILNASAVRGEDGTLVYCRCGFRDITDLKRAQEAQRETEERFSKAFESNPASLTIVHMGTNKVLEVNDAWTDVFGYTREEAVGRTTTALGIYDERTYAQIIEEAKSKGSIRNVEATVKNRKGEDRVLLVSREVIGIKGEPYLLAMGMDITKRKVAEKALKDSEERFRILAHGAFEGIMITRDGIILDFNEVFGNMSGYPLNELVGRHIREILTPESDQITMEHIHSGSDEPYESEFRHRDGHVVPIKVKAKIIPYEGGTARIASVRDIQASKKAEEIQNRLVTAIEQAAESVLITNANGIIQYVNPAMENISGFNMEEMIGKSPRMFKSGEHDENFYKQLWSTIKAGNIWSGKFTNRRKDGRLYYEDATISPVKDASGKIVNFVAVKRDITETLELSKQLLQAQKMEAVGTLAGGVAHDFNNILQVALGYSELILDDEELPQRYKADLNKIYDAARRGAELVQRLLTFSKKTEAERRPLSLNRRINEVLKMLERTVPKMIGIEVSLAADLPAIHADPTQMDQILMNLAVNARDAMPDGGKLVFETANIFLDEEYSATHLNTAPGHYVLLTVTDNGSGMDQETIEHIFEPFYTTKATGKGTGLGLAMVYGIVAQHGGQIRCYSVPGEGTSFKIYFPALVSEEQALKPGIRSMPPGGSETILLVDDEQAIRDLCFRMLTKSGYNVISAHNGRQALDIYEAESSSISLVIMDLIMPEMGGKQCLENLLSINPAAKVIIASGFSEKGLPNEIAARAKAFVNKPYDARRVLEVVRTVLDEKTD